MIIRAVFWIGLVAFLMPHEPDLGFGRPGAPVTKAAHPGWFASVQTIALRNLEQVRADLASNGHGWHRRN